MTVDGDALHFEMLKVSLPIGVGEVQGKRQQARIYQKAPGFQSGGFRL
ncbi:hypothetical protein [Robbsia andropogonis]|nr:hypothetical protein [Robbsia andropogonis]